MTAMAQTGTVAPTRFVVDVTNSARDLANSGVNRVTRRFSRELQKTATPLFVIWEGATGYVLPTREERDLLSKFNGPVVMRADRVSADASNRIKLEDVLPKLSVYKSWLLLPETMIEDQFWVIRRYARKLGLRIGAIFYDAIPILRPELCNAETRINHQGYMKGLAECDFVMPISEFSCAGLRQFWQERGIPETHVEVNLLPGEFGGADRSAAGPGPLRPVSILCVSTLEPRKNHRRLIAACLRLQEQRPDLEWSLTLVGNRYAGALDIAEYVEHVAASTPRIRWLGIVDDDKLRRLYSKSSFTVYPSIIEGFGMPILESISYGKPCLCANNGVMAELASEGGCVTVDVEDTVAISDAIVRLVEDFGLRQRLSTAASRRRLKSWQHYVRDFLLILESPNVQRQISMGIPELQTQEPQTPLQPESRVGIVYPQQRVYKWPMHDLERLALIALLARMRPKCAIGIGTHSGASLSLLAECAELVYSVDIDPDVPDPGHVLSNVTYLMGRSERVLPILFEELNSNGIPVNFVIIDGNHSAEGMRGDISLVLEYAPPEPMFVLAHNSCNPNCRQGVLEAPWQDSRYCHFLDLDFVPGRHVECPAPNHGELCGGLAMAFFHPPPRSGPLYIASASAYWLR